MIGALLAAGAMTAQAQTTNTLLANVSFTLTGVVSNGIDSTKTIRVSNSDIIEALSGATYITEVNDSTVTNITTVTNIVSGTNDITTVTNITPGTNFTFVTNTMPVFVGTNGKLIGNAKLILLTSSATHTGPAFFVRQFNTNDTDVSSLLYAILPAVSLTNLPAISQTNVLANAKNTYQIGEFVLNTGNPALLSFDIIGSVTETFGKITTKGMGTTIGVTSLQANAAGNGTADNGASAVYTKATINASTPAMAQGQ
jgi:hypothetical protein